MTMIQIRHVPADVHRKFQLRAARAGMTLSDYLRTELERSAERLSADELREQLAAMEPVTVREAPVRAIRRERDRA